MQVGETVTWTNEDSVAHTATSDGNFGVGIVLHIDANTGKQKVIADKGLLVGPVGIAIEEDGQLIIGDPYTVNPKSLDLADGGYDGAIIRINPVTHKQTLIARGHGSAMNARGVLIVPNPKPAIKPL